MSSLLKLRYSLFLFFLLITSNLSAESKEFQIGKALSLSGQFQEYAKECEEGFSLAVGESSLLLKEKVGFLTEDDQSNPKGAVNAVQKLLRSNNLLAMTLFSSSHVLAAQSLSVANKIPVLGLSGHPEFLKNNPYGVSCWQETEAEAKAFFNWMLENNIRTVGIVTLENDYTLSLRDYIKKWSEESDIKIIFDELIFDQTDYRSQIAKLRQNPPEVLFLNLFGPGFSNYLRQLQEQGYKGQKLSLNANARGEYLKAAGKEASEGVIFYGPNYYQDYFLKLFPPTRDVSEGMSYVYSCYLGMKLVLSGVEELLASQNLTRENLHLKLTATDSFMVGGEKIEVKNRRIQFGLSKSIARDGKIVY